MSMWTADKNFGGRAIGVLFRRDFFTLATSPSSRGVSPSSAARVTVSWDKSMISCQLRGLRKPI